MSLNLDEITFSIRLFGVRSWAHNRDELNGFDWAGVEDVLLTKAQFAGLRTVRMRLIFDEEMSFRDWEDLIGARWPDFAKRGMLVVEKQHV